MLLSSITLRNLLSFKDTTAELVSLNVLIGPNASGKSNFIEAISLLQAAPQDLARAIHNGGGIRAWAWKGGPEPYPAVSLVCTVAEKPGLALGAYELKFSEDAQGFVVMEERLRSLGGPGETETYFDRRGGRVNLSRTPAPGEEVEIPRTASVLSEFRSPLDPTPITHLGRSFGRIRIYRQFNTGPWAPARVGMATTGPKEFLEDGGDNLALVLSEMLFERGTGPRIRSYLKRFCEQFENVGVKLGAGIAEVHVQEEGMRDSTPAVRLSDGTLKFLCLLVVLLNPAPAPLICLEEPEVGLHPDALQLVAEMLIEASERAQLIVTTHSADLVDALSDHPEAVVVCERDFDHSTQFKRLSPQQLEAWLEHYKLGELWRKGEIGGNRW